MNMKIVPPARLFRQADANPVEERARTREAQPESAFAGLKKKLKDKLPDGPTRFSFSVPSVFQGLTRTAGSAQPDVRGAPPPRVAISDRKLAATELDKINAKAELALGKMQAVHHPSTQMQRDPATASAMSNVADFRREVAAMFGDVPAARELAQAILDTVPPAGGTAQPGVRPLKAPLVLATALNTVCLSEAPLAQAAQLLQDLRGGVESPKLFSLQRVLAATAPGTEALCTAMGIADARKEPFCDALRMCSALEKKGVDVGVLSSPRQVLMALERDNRLGLDQPIGGNDDPPLRLLGKALRYAEAAAQAGPAGPASLMEWASPTLVKDKPAYVAWKKGGFVDSGKDSDFNKAIERLFKFSTYVDRADHGPRTFKNMVKDMSMLVRNMVGVEKSPLTMSRNGMSGGNLGTMAQEAAKFKLALNDTISPIRHHYHRQLSDPFVLADSRRFHSALARTAALDVWAGKDGRVNVPIPASEVAARAAQLQGALPGAPALDQALLQRQLKDFATSHQRHRGELSVQFRLKTLKAVGAELAGKAPEMDKQALAALRAESRALRSIPDRSAEQNRRLDAVQSQLLPHTHVAVAEARAIKSARTPTKNLFEFKDLYRMLTSTPREGPTAADAHRQFQSISGGKLESMTRMEAGRTRGINVDPAVVLAPVTTALGIPAVPLVLPGFGHTSTRSAVVEAGDSLTGGRFYVGTQKNTSNFGQFGAGVVLPLPNGGGVSVPLGVLAGGRDTVEGEGACINTRIDVPGWEQKSAQVVDFMFDQAIPPAGQQRPQTPAEFWQRFSDTFGDDPNVTMSMVKNAAQVSSQSFVFGAAVRAQITPDMSVGPAALASVSRTRVSSQLNTAALGADVPTSYEGKTISAAASISVAQANPMAPLPSGDVLGLGTLLPYGNMRVDKNIEGQFGLGRIGRNADGTVAPFASQRIIGFRDPDEMIAYVQSNMNTWVEAIRDQDPRNLDPDNNDPANKQTTEGARALLQSFLQQIKKAPARGDINFGEFRTLQPAVADRISDYEARIDTLQGKGDGDASRRALSEPAKREINQVQNEIHRLLSDISSWKPTALYGLENVGRSESAGVDLLAKVGGSRSISATRLTALLIAALPETPVPDVPV